MFSKVLVANRGEIACRVIESAKNTGYSTVAVFSEADKNARHVTLADQAVFIGQSEVSASYLKIDAIIGAAKSTGADAIHPGYGFLSENAEFAKACKKNNIVFIGPPIEAIALMGSKRLSKIAMIKAGVPCIGGYEGAKQTDKLMIAEAEKIGFPVMIKASAGGGGRGMRIVEKLSDMASSLESARRESKNAFGSDELILEKAIINPRHIEIQVFADNFGNTIYLGERDCSIQRRHQKVIEEAPSVFIGQDLRAQMGKAAVNAAKSCNYVGAGTVEFLVDTEKNFYFLEMNTRLQVEHPVTEIITGIDLVLWQLMVANNEKLPLSQDQVTYSGHAIEARLYSEDTSKSFLPQSGHIEYLELPESEGIRVDHGLLNNQEVSPYYDPMLAKIIGYGNTREEARRRLIRALKATKVLGVTTNKSFLIDIISHDAFAKSNTTTAFIEQHLNKATSLNTYSPSAIDFAIAGLLFYYQTLDKSPENNSYIGWSNSLAPTASIKIGVEDILTNILIRRVSGKFIITAMGQTIKVDLESLDNNKLIYTRDHVKDSVVFALKHNDLTIDFKDKVANFSNLSNLPAVSEDALGNGIIKAQMEGKMIDIKAKVNQKVVKGDLLMVIEAMKIEHPIEADVDGVIKTINASVGSQIKNRSLLVEIEPERGGD